MQQSRGFWISGKGVTGPRTQTTGWLAAVLYQRDNNSLVKLVRSNLGKLELGDQGLLNLLAWNWGACCYI